MDKGQIATKLTEMGYKAVLENGVIMCTLELKKDARGLRDIFRGLSYNGSWGYKIEKGAGNEAETICSGENSGEVSDNRNDRGDVVLPHEELSEHSSIRGRREQEESDGSLSDDESECRSVEEEQIEGQMSIMDLFG